MVLVVPDPVHRAGVVRLQARHMIIDFLREEQLGGVCVGRVGRLERAGEEVRGRRRRVEVWWMDFEVDVNGAAGVPSWEDSLEDDFAVCASLLDTAEECGVLNGSAGDPIQSNGRLTVVGWA
jgi:hypothetical protein